MAKKQTSYRTSFPLAATEGFGDDKGKVVTVKSDITKDQAKGFAKLTRLKDPSTGTLYTPKQVKQMAKTKYGLTIGEESVQTAREYYRNQPAPKKNKK
jgi:hypothetical protein